MADQAQTEQQFSDDELHAALQQMHEQPNQQPQQTVLEKMVASGLVDTPETAPVQNTAPQVETMNDEAEILAEYAEYLSHYSDEMEAGSAPVEPVLPDESIHDIQQADDDLSEYHKALSNYEQQVGSEIKEHSEQTTSFESKYDVHNVPPAENKEYQNALNNYKTVFEESFAMRKDFIQKGYSRERSDYEAVLDNAKSKFGDFTPDNKQFMKSNNFGGAGVTVTDNSGNQHHFANQFELFERVVEENKKNGDYFDTAKIKLVSEADHSRFIEMTTKLDEAKKGVMECQGVPKEQKFADIEQIQKDIKAQFRQSILNAGIGPTGQQPTNGFNHTQANQQPAATGGLSFNINKSPEHNGEKKPGILSRVKSRFLGAKETLLSNSVDEKEDLNTMAAKNAFIAMLVNREIEQRLSQVIEQIKSLNEAFESFLSTDEGALFKIEILDKGIKAGTEQFQQFMANNPAVSSAWSAVAEKLVDTENMVNSFKEVAEFANDEQGLMEQVSEKFENAMDNLHASIGDLTSQITNGISSIIRMARGQSRESEPSVN